MLVAVSSSVLGLGSVKLEEFPLIFNLQIMQQFYKCKTCTQKKFKFLKLLSS